ncbi:trace amine-associated receptor 1-like [Clarias gariepinus]|uniref:trace amine-associated receptor 1-like n=1 Tax=Clarias gariepinus TaxID=13013 RepID=UPI00234C6939|nr:trace amine-associated receptor 1-like [Clarias gariepinus]
MEFPAFGDASETADVFNFIEQADNYLEIRPLTSPELLGTLGTVLRGPALSWWKAKKGRKISQEINFEMNLSQTLTLDIIPLCYEFLNSSCAKFSYPFLLKVLLYVFFSIVVILTVFGNFFVILSIVHFKQLHMPTNYLVLSLAVTDLLLGGFVMPPNAIRSVETCWYFGTLFYRYYAVCKPLLYRTIITPFITLIMICICWSISFTVGFGGIFFGLNILVTENFHNEGCEGGCVLLQSAASSTASSLLVFYFPGIIMISIYTKIFCVAKKQVKSIQVSKNKAQLIISKDEKKATKTLALVMGVFLSLWTPFFICNIIDPFTGFLIPHVLFEMMGWIGYLNSTCNPIVYAFFYKWFRKALRTILSGKIFHSGSSRINLFSY